MLEAIITGNVGSLRFVRAGEITVLNINVASSRKIEDRQYTDWVAAKLWGERAEKLRPHITVGAKLLLRGRPEAKGFQKADGTATGELILHIREIEFLSKSRPTDSEKGAEESQMPLAVTESSKKKPRKQRTEQ